MPLQQINVTPFKLIEDDEVTPACLNKNQDGKSESQSSNYTSTSSEICRICHCEGDMEGGFIAPCYCAGSLRYVHQNCLQHWIKTSGIRCCELCKFQFIMHTKTKPFFQWESLEMTDFEKKKLICTAVFQLLAVTCLAWTLYTLINGASEEMVEGISEWMFWTKMLIVAVAFFGGVFFMFAQCKSYITFFQRWRAYNKVVYVQSVPEKQPLSLQAPSSCESVTSQFEMPKSAENEGNFEEEPNINRKVANDTHLLFNDECRIYLHNECIESEDGLAVLPPIFKLCRALGLT